MSSNSFTSVSTAEFEQLIQQPEMQLVDVRTTEEYINGHIPGAVNMNVTDPTGFFSEQIITLDKLKPVAIYCRSGVRSKLAAKEMVSIGLQVFELGGGIIDWLSHGKPVDDIEEE
ncbi:MAG: rhodanese-like domain-containing protein [Bacteroidales bacterium]|nr:rhodanese-like domain-containing protein [Bacteroidales bacterium]